MFLPAPVLADHRPKHVPDIEEPSLVTQEIAPVGVAAEVTVGGAAEVLDLSGSHKDDTDTREEVTDQDLVDSQADQKEDKLKVDKAEKAEKAEKVEKVEKAEKVEKDKLRVPGQGESDAAHPKDACADGCEKGKAQGKEASIGLPSATAGSAEVILGPTGSGSEAVDQERASAAKQLLSAEKSDSPTINGGLLAVDGALLAGTAQPSLAIVVNALNDADGDGIYADSETAPSAGTDISFKAIITNIGSTAFEIASVSQSFMQKSGRVQIEVCADLDGLIVGFGESLACSFSVSDYSPPLGESVVSTITASAIEVTGSGRRGTSDSDNSTVATLLGDQVLAVAIERATDPLAFTGTEAARLLALALVLLAAGGALLYASRVRRALPGRPVVWVGPRFSVGRPTITRSGDPRPAEKAVPR
ncbi:MAG TPA: hypothetical protein VGZ50_04170 [Actinomycetota bacterium]|nr:hypothetical protein [Actinomycetota bacterium]